MIATNRIPHSVSVRVQGPAIGVRSRVPSMTKRASWARRSERFVQSPGNSAESGFRPSTPAARSVAECYSGLRGRGHSKPPRAAIATFGLAGVHPHRLSTSAASLEPYWDCRLGAAAMAALMSDVLVRVAIADPPRRSLAIRVREMSALILRCGARVAPKTARVPHPRTQPSSTLAAHSPANVPQGSVRVLAHVSGYLAGEPPQSAKCRCLLRRSLRDFDRWERFAA